MVLEGDVAESAFPSSGCHFHPRRRYAVERCAQEEPDLSDTGNGHLVRCLRTEELDLA
ncbi:MAG: hypothetical protein F4Y08_03055 [Caldilineaceae bacterium SB0662_bin_9]|uniref:Oligopeptide/dipeptide ABC transporter C-terminal domain-containing protein n=1 Tax=Caldilineaceae bacterium SB0662_bin_9 TaxID=2605258 RepID=A0A6B1DR38_9CHLR|nr:hypothetical protein [Caldilineaceae bacterium SB0662_bin_9]